MSSRPKETVRDARNEPIVTESDYSTRAYFSIAELARRWRCSRGSVYNRLRSAGAEVLDFAAPGKKGQKLVSATLVREIEFKKTKRLM